jgi:two-component system sensor histidine kinase KdpD
MPPDSRPDPDQLLSAVQTEQSRRGRLKIFFGYAAGVGKTYAMLSAARRDKEHGVDVVIGYVEPHGRPETTALTEGLPVVPTRGLEYRGVTLQEFDLDAALVRKPELILVDELAHTNAEGSRHAKRWQDVLELLDAGIDVYSTLNVQHLESLIDVIASITGVIVRETLPDAVLEQAAELELIDITPEELRERLEAGKIYLAPQAARAINSFFQKTNLVALRELSLRQTATRISRDVEKARQQRGVTQPWLTSERLLVCIGPSPTSAKVLRAAKRLAVSLDAPWIAVSVDPGFSESRSGLAQAQISAHLRLAEQLDAETHVLVGDDVADTILNFARDRNVSKIIVGKTAQRGWRRLLPSLVDRLLANSGDIDVYVIRGDEQEPAAAKNPVPPKQLDRRPYWWALLVVAICSALSEVVDRFELADANLVMIYLLGVVFVATRFGQGPAIMASCLGVLSFDYFFVAPEWTFTVSDTQYVLTFFVMLLVGLLVSRLTDQVRRQLRAAQERERRTHTLYRLTRQLAEANGSEFLVSMAGRQLQDVFQAQVLIYLNEGNQPSLRYGQQNAIANDAVNNVVAAWVAEHQQIAGWGTDTLPNATALFLPLIGTVKTLGALGVRPTEEWRVHDPEERRLLESCATQFALAIERDQLALAAHDAELRVETEVLRNSLLSSVSHDLRTPLAAISGAGTSLLAQESLDQATKHELLATIVDESQRLSRLVENLLDMTRLESGKLQLHTQWHVLEELVGSALARVRKLLADHPLEVHLPADLPLLSVDGLLIEQVLVNLLENAARYTPPGTALSISAATQGDVLSLKIRDHGPGLVPGQEEKLFEKFYQSPDRLPDSRRGVGLGLAICRAILTAHHGTITARNAPSNGALKTESGAVFEIQLPLQTPPAS